MIETFYGTNQLQSPAALAAALVLGMAFGFVLERAGFGSSRRLAAVFYFRDMAVVKVMFTAMLTAMLVLGYLHALGWLAGEQLHLLPTVYGASIVGGLLFGIGFVLSGWCPGTGAVGAACGKWDAIVFLLGTVFGSLLFAEVFPWLRSLYTWGELPQSSQAFGMPFSLAVLAMAVLAAAVFAGCEWIERRPTVAAKTSPAARARGVATAQAVGLAGVILAAGLMVFPRAPRESVAADLPVLARFQPQQLLETVEAGQDHLEPEDLAEALLRGDEWLVIDVRPVAEYARFHIRGSQHVPLPELLARLRSVPVATPIVLYSNGMTHPAQARDILAQHGFTRVFLLTDGLQGFLDRCLTPVSLRDGPVSPDEAQRIEQWRAYFLAPRNGFSPGTD